MKRILFPLLLLSLLVLAAQGANSGSPNRYGAMAKSAMEMMDAFSSAYQKRGNAAGKQSQGNMSWPQGMSSWSPGSMPMQMGSMGMMNSMPMGWGNTPWSQGAMPAMPSWPQGSMPSMPWNQGSSSSDPGYGGGYGRPSYPQDTRGPGVELNGSWQGKGGDLLEIRNNRFRIYQDQAHFREGNLTFEDHNSLAMQDPASGNIQHFEYAQHEGKLVLRDQAGNLFLYRRIQ